MQKKNKKTGEPMFSFSDVLRFQLDLPREGKIDKNFLIQKLVFNFCLGYTVCENWDTTTYDDVPVRRYFEKYKMLPKTHVNPNEIFYTLYMEQRVQHWCGTDKPEDIKRHNAFVKALLIRLVEVSD